MKSVFGILGVTLFAALSIQAEDWPNWRGPNFDGRSKEKIPDELPSELPVAWRAQVGIGFSTVSVMGNRLLTMGNIDGVDWVFCLDSKSGKEIWKHSYACELDPRYYEGGPSATPTIHEGSVYTLSRKGHAFRLSLENGEVEWSRDLIKDHQLELPEWSFASSAFLDKEKVLLNAGRGGIALDRKTGKTLWLPSTESSGYATVVPFSRGGASHLLFSAKALIGFSAEDGKAHWEFSVKSSRDVNAADPLVFDNRIMVSSSGGTYLLEVSEKGEVTELWKQPDLKWYFNAGVKIADHVYSIHGTTHRPTELICTEVETGKTVWSEEGFGSGALMAAGDAVIIFDNGKLTVFRASPEKYDPILSQKLLDGKCWTVPVLANGMIYCRSAEGELVAVSLPK